jgi:hypothetical protein
MERASRVASSTASNGDILGGWLARVAQSLVANNSLHGDRVRLPLDVAFPRLHKEFGLGLPIVLTLSTRTLQLSDDLLLYLR